MRFGFDLDEVVVDLTKEIEDYLSINYGIEWPAECFIKYDFTDCHFTNNVELNNKIIEDLVVIANDTDFQFKAEPVKNAVNVLQKLKKDGHKLYFITNRPKQNQPLTYRWLRNNKIPFDDLKFVGKQEEKGVWGQRFKLDMYVDDLYTHLESMYRYKKRWRKGLILFDRPWNSHSIDSTRYTRINNWKEILRHIGVANR